MAAMAPDLPKLTAAESEELAKRRRGRNVALLIVLLALASVFYVLAMVKLGKPS